MKNNTAFVLLAGGKSQRMGKPKGLLKYGDSYWILEQLNRISQTKISKVYIGLGYDHQQYFKAISWFKEAELDFVKYRHLGVKISINSMPEKGPFSTLQSVLVQTGHMDVLVNPIDVPLLNSVELDAICAIENTVVIPNNNGKNGHPIKLNAALCASLSSLDPSDKMPRLDLQIKRLDPDKITTISIKDPSILMNLNDMETWTSYLNRAKIS